MEKVKQLRLVGASLATIHCRVALGDRVAAETHVPGAGAAGCSQEDWKGNSKADEAAKTKARSIDLSPELVAKWASHSDAVQAVWRLIAEYQVMHLAARPRRADASVAKSWKQKAPARPCRRTRRRLGGPAAEQPIRQAQPNQKGVAWACPTPPRVVDGVHDLCRRPGPYRPPVGPKLQPAACFAGGPAANAGRPRPTGFLRC